MQIMRAAFPEFYVEGFEWTKELLEFMARPVKVFWSVGLSDLRSPTLLKWATAFGFVKEKDKAEKKA